MCLGAGHIVKLKGYPIDAEAHHRFIYHQRGLQNRSAAIDHLLAQPGIHMAGNRARQAIAKHIGAASSHSWPGDYILAGGLGHKARWRDNRHIVSRCLLSIYQRQHTTKMIYMTMGKYHAGQINFAQMLLGKCHSCRRGFQCGQGVHQNPAIVAFNQAGIGQIKPSQLIDAFIYFK